ncbi:MAG: hypothetical protein SGILL_002180 [Bacillariaceae sp.]
MSMLAAPTLAQLPPERGTVLELHSINDEHNGMLVEYHGISKETGKYLVVPLKMDLTGDEEEDENAKFTRVKPKCCRRPTLKPLKLRQVLGNLAIQIVNSEARESSPDYASIEVKLKGLLVKDPCCAVAYMLLAQTVHNSGQKAAHAHCEGDPLRPFTEQMKKQQDKTISYLYRTLGNAYAYSGLLPEADVKNSRNMLSGLLSLRGHKNTALRQYKKAELLSGESLYGGLEKTGMESVMANRLVKKSLESKEAGLFSKESDQLMQAMVHFMNTLRTMVNIKGDAVTVPGGGSVASHTGPTLVNEIFSNLVRLNAILQESIDAEKAVSIATCVADTIDDMYLVCNSSGISSGLEEGFWGAAFFIKLSVLQVKSGIEGTKPKMTSLGVKAE